MRALRHGIAALEAWFGRRTAALGHPRAPLVAAVLVPVLFGVLALLLGQDDNWDLKNYHLYNPYALLNGRIDIDLAPAVWQSYFNPTLDLPYYWLTSRYPAPMAGFIFGLIHGLDVVLVLVISRELLGGAPARLPLLLAAAGACGVGFLSELGNSMGDNMTALFVLAALAVALRYWETLQQWNLRSALPALGSGMLMGLGTGLKLTNAPYALALCLAFLVVPVSLARRARLAFLFGAGVTAGIAASAGYWFLILWRSFGNPFFPQFNDIFHSPLAQPVGVIDRVHLPRNLVETVSWPFVFTLDFTRVAEVVLKQAVLPVLYVLGLMVACCWLRERVSGKAARSQLSARSRFVLLFGAVAYLVWLRLFSIYRYLIPLELLAPLMVWMLVQRMAPPDSARRIGGWVLVATSLAVFPFATWGHVGWAAKSFSAQVPPIRDPASTIVFITHAEPPLGWLATFLPKEVRVMSVGAGFPETPAYVERVDSAIASRPGPHYVMLAAGKNDKESGRQRKLAIATALGLTATAEGCDRLDRFLRRVRFQVQVQRLAAGPGPRCTLELPPELRRDLPARDRAIVAAAEQALSRYRLALDRASCAVYPAAIGAEPNPYQLCRVTVKR
jgi:hypothetical protein